MTESYQHITIEEVSASHYGPCNLCKYKEPGKRDKVFQVRFHFNPRQCSGVNLCKDHLKTLKELIDLALDPLPKRRKK